jgi:glutaredoxin
MSVDIEMPNKQDNHTILFELPSQREFTIYCKKSCSYCEKAITLLENKKVIYYVIKSDDYCLKNKNEFISFVQEKTKNKWNKTFPIIFHNEKYIGGFTDLEKYIEKIFVPFDSFLL